MALSAALLVQAIYFSIVYAKSRKRSKGRRRNEATFGALITTMRKCFKCDRSQKRRRRLLSGNAVKGSQHFALSALSFSLYFALYLSLSMQWRRHFVFRITMGHGTRKFTACCGKLWRWRSRKRLVAAYAVCLAISLSLSLSACLFVCLSVCTVSVAGLSLPFPFRSPLPRYLRLLLSLSLSLSLSICLSVFRALPL